MNIGTKKYIFSCPLCNSSYEIGLFRIEYLPEYSVLQCDSCAEQIAVKKHPNKGISFFKKIKIEYKLNSCSCNGRYKFKAPLRCPVCKNKVDIEEIKRQVKWWGTPNGRPGVCMKDCTIIDKSVDADF